MKKKLKVLSKKIISSEYFSKFFPNGGFEMHCAEH